MRVIKLFKRHHRFSLRTSLRLFSALLAGGVSTASTGVATAVHASTVTVKKGDTVSGIAKDHNVPVSDVIKDNHLDPKATIHPNQQLTINDVPDTYTVKKGDTVSGIANHFGLKTADVLNWNNLSWNNATILVGQKLNLKDNNQQNQATSSQSTNNATSNQTVAPQGTNNNSNAVPVGDTVSQKAVSLALQYAHMGIPYVWGGTTPSGFDCSGLTQYIYRQLGVNINRTAADQVANTTTKAVSQAQPGDLLFWQNSTGVYHVAIYIGNNQYVAAPTFGQNVQVQTISQYFAPSFAGSINR